MLRLPRVPSFAPTCLSLWSILSCTSATHSLYSHRDGGASQFPSNPFASQASLPKLPAACHGSTAQFFNLQSFSSPSSLHPLSPLPSIHHLARRNLPPRNPRRRTTDIRAVEEAHEQVHERAQVEHVQPHRERLPAGVDAADGLVLLVWRARGPREEDAAVRGDGRGWWGGGGGGVGDGDVVGEEGVRGGVVDADYELGDLERGEGLLDGLGDADGEGGDGVVCVLRGGGLASYPDKEIFCEGRGGVPSVRGLRS